MKRLTLISFFICALSAQLDSKEFSYLNSGERVFFGLIKVNWKSGVQFQYLAIQKYLVKQMNESFGNIESIPWDYEWKETESMRDGEGYILYCLNRTNGDYIFFAGRFNEYNRRQRSFRFSYIAQDSRQWKRGNLDNSYTVTGARWKSKVKIDVDKRGKYGTLRYKLSHIYAR